METVMDKVTAAVKCLNESLNQYEEVQNELAELIRYYESPQWMEDYEADCAGEIPKDLKRGVLSEDGVYNLISERNELNERLRRIVNAEE